uniref:Dolichol kinase n=1 Tax=Octactis speculum TaxID=3111310 RepID=A0A7S2DMS8_9STRA|mmetsp:Transcript_51337/g.69922  ORF Transcript_51337/g.69922 Transcript_51337/m.69922 type:complete len:301 (+) Transcript_51337:83-985(+)
MSRWAFLASLCIFTQVSCLNVPSVSSRSMRQSSFLNKPRKPELRSPVKCLATAGLAVSVGRDAASSLFGLGAATIWLKTVTSVATRGLVDPTISRKIIHCGSAPLFLLTWPLFSSSLTARFFASAIPIFSLLRIIKASQGEKERDLLAAISRSGGAHEALGGPFIYSLNLLAATLFGWRTSLISVVAIAQMAAGDGLADIIGRRFGASSWTFSPTKSMEGSAAFVVGGFVCSMALIGWLSSFKVLSLGYGSGWLSFAALAPRILGISLACAAIELVTLVDDNYSVPVLALVLGHIFLRAN